MEDMSNLFSIPEPAPTSPPPILDILYRILENVSRIEGMILAQKAPSAPTQEVAAFGTVQDPLDGINFF